MQAIEGEQNRNKHLDKIILGLDKIHKAGSKVTISQSRLDLKKLFPSKYFTLNYIYKLEIYVKETNADFLMHIYSQSLVLRFVRGFAYNSATF